MTSTLTDIPFDKESERQVNLQLRSTADRVCNECPLLWCDGYPCQRVQSAMRHQELVSYNESVE